MGACISPTLADIQGVSKKCTHTSNDEKSFIYEHTVK